VNNLRRTVFDQNLDSVETWSSDCLFYLVTQLVVVVQMWLRSSDTQWFRVDRAVIKEYSELAKNILEGGALPAGVV
jgi:hypothetical protein